MIISASRRTDIPAAHAEWMFRRLREGFALVRNPMNPRSVSRVSLAREDVDGIVFWTKDPAPSQTCPAARRDWRASGGWPGRSARSACSGGTTRSC